MEILRSFPVCSLVALSIAVPGAAQQVPPDTVWAEPVPPAPKSETRSVRASLAVGAIGIDQSPLMTVGLRVSETGTGPGVELVLTTVPTAVIHGLLVVGLDVNLAARLPERGVFVTPWVGPSLVAGLAPGGGADAVVGGNAGLALGRVERYGVGVRFDATVRAYLRAPGPFLHLSVSVIP